MAQEYIRGAVSLGDFKLDHGETLTDAQLGFACWSDDASMSAPVVVLPSYFSGDAESYAPWVGADGLFDPKNILLSPLISLALAYQVSPHGVMDMLHGLTLRYRIAYGLNAMCCSIGV